MAMLDGKVCFITGGASGIGRGTALRFGRERAKIGLADVAGQEKEAKGAIDEIARAGGDAVFLPCDVSHPGDVERAVGRTVERFGRLDVVFANAGVNGVWTPIEELKPEEWDKTLDINL